MRQYLSKNGLIILLWIALIAIFIIGGMYFRHVVYVEPTTENTSENHITLSKTQLLHNNLHTNTLAIESDGAIIFVHITYLDSLNGGNFHE